MLYKDLPKFERNLNSVYVLTLLSEVNQRPNHFGLMFEVCLTQIMCPKNSLAGPAGAGLGL